MIQATGIHKSFGSLEVLKGIDLHIAHFDTRAYADLHHVSIEMAARELRYRWFGELCMDFGTAGV